MQPISTWLFKGSRTASSRDAEAGFKDCARAAGHPQCTPLGAEHSSTQMRTNRSSVTVSIEPRLAGERKPSIAQPIEINAIHSSCGRAAGSALRRCHWVAASPALSGWAQTPKVRKRLFVVAGLRTLCGPACQCQSTSREVSIAVGCGARQHARVSSPTPRAALLSPRRCCTCEHVVGGAASAPTDCR